MRPIHLLTLSLLMLASACAAAAPQAGEMAPDIVGYDAEGRPASLSDYRGRVVVVSFWASWCGPCLKELPILEGIQNSAGKRQIQVIAVNIESRDTFRQLVKKLADFQVMVTHDAAKASSKAYGVDGIPHMIIIDRTGHIVRINQGYNEAALDGIVADINRALLAKNDATTAAPAARP